MAVTVKVAGINQKLDRTSRKIDLSRVIQRDFQDEFTTLERKLILNFHVRGSKAKKSKTKNSYMCFYKTYRQGTICREEMCGSGS